MGNRSLPRGRYSGRSDAGCLYELTVKLLSEHEDVLAEFSSGQVAVPPDSDDAGWIQVNLEVPGDGAGPGKEGRGSWESRPRNEVRDYLGEVWKRDRG